MSELQPITLHSVYVFDCEQCGRENIVRPIPVELSPDEMEELRDSDLKCKPGDWVTMPETFKCKFCGQEYECRAAE